MYVPMGISTEWRERENQTHTLVGLCSVKVTKVATSRSPPSELHSDTISSHTHSLIDEVEGAATRVVYDLEMIFHESFDVVAVSGHYSESIDCRAEPREHHMTTGTCTKAGSHTHSLCLSFHTTLMKRSRWWYCECVLHYQYCDNARVKADSHWLYM